MPALSERKIEIVRTLVESAPDAIIGNLQRALADTGYDTALADVRQLVDAEARDRQLRNAVLQPVAGLCRVAPPGELALRFPPGVLPLIWRGVGADAASTVAQAAAAFLDYSRDEPPPEVFDQLADIAAHGLRERVSPGFRKAAELCDQARPSGAEQMAACLDLAPVVRRAALRLHEWTAHTSDETKAAARLAFKDAAAIAEDAGPRFFEMLAAQLEHPWIVLRIISSVMDKPTERYLAESELAGFGERAIVRIDEALGAIGSFDASGGPEVGGAAARQVEMVTQMINEVECCVDLSRSNDWGRRIAAQKMALADVVEARFRDAEKQFGLALPMQGAKLAKIRRTVPKLTQMPDPMVTNRALTLLTFARDVRGSANFGGFASSRSKLLEKLGDTLDKYVEEILDQIRNSEIADMAIARAYLALTADMALLVRDAKAADLVRRRTVAACQDAALVAQAG